MIAPATALNLAGPITASDDPDSPILAWRDPAAGTRPLSLMKHMYVERGTLEDWHLLHELHYKASNNGIGPRYVRLVIDDGVNPAQTIGVMVFTVPKPLDSGRNQVFPHLRPNQNGRDNRLINVQRMAWINKNLILSSRTVLDTMYRGGGIAYRFKNIGYRLMGFRYVESRSSMSRYNPFSIKAGMRFVKPKSAPAFETGLAFFARHFKSPAYDYVAIKAEIEAMPDYLREHTLKELRAFYYRNSSMEKSGDNRLNGTSRVEQMELGYLLKQTQQLVFGATVYAAWTNPDWDPNTQAMRALPARIPLCAFDNQGVNEPLRLDLLETPV
jgi:ABC-type ATPase with predicted acetyltransferase domain